MMSAANRILSEEQTAAPFRVNDAYDFDRTTDSGPHEAAAPGTSALPRLIVRHKGAASFIALPSAAHEHATPRNHRISNWAKRPTSCRSDRGRLPRRDDALAFHTSRHRSAAQMGDGWNGSSVSARRPSAASPHGCRAAPSATVPRPGHFQSSRRCNHRSSTLSADGGCWCRRNPRSGMHAVDWAIESSTSKSPF